VSTGSTRFVVACLTPASTWPNVTRFTERFAEKKVKVPRSVKFEVAEFSVDKTQDNEAGLSKRARNREAKPAVLFEVGTIVLVDRKVND
jgi:hypothetical protein